MSLRGCRNESPLNFEWLLEFDVLREGMMKTLLLAIVSLSVLVSCSEMGTRSSPSLLPTIERQVSESLYEEYAVMRAAQVRDVNYQLSVKLDSDSETFSAVNQINFKLAKDNANDLTIDFEKGDIKSLTVNGKPISVDFKEFFITVKNEYLKFGNNTILIDYERPYSTDGSGLHRFKDPKDGNVYLYSNFEPYSANRFFPHFDQPDLKSTYTLTVEAPKDWVVITAIRESQIESLGDRQIWTFPESAKFSSYVFSLHAGNYAVWEDEAEGVPLRLFSRQSLKKYVKKDEWFIPTKQSLKFFNEYFDLDYPFLKYDQVIAPDFNSVAMENVAAVTFNESFIRRGEKSTAEKMRLANVIAHEMAHMWFGNLVTMRWWNGLWLNESFATYMANLEVDKASYFKNAWDVFYSRTKQWAYRSDDSVNTHAIELPIPSTGDALSNFDGITYGKGASVLKQLPYYLGEEQFRRGVRNYLKKFAFQNTDLDDFIGELGKAAEKDMTQWTQDWLYSAGLNTIKASFQCGSGKITQFTITQSAPADYPTLREQRVQIGLYQESQGQLNLMRTEPVLYQGESTDVSTLVGESCPSMVYPNEGDWGFVKVELDKKSLRTAESKINQIANTTMRIMLWQSLEDSVREGKTSALKLLNLVKANVGNENSIIVQRKINSAMKVALRYVKRATLNKQTDYTSVINQTEDLLFDLLKKSRASSDSQKLWFDAYVRLVQSPKHLQRIQQILNGSTTFSGLDIDQDKRWKIVAKINRYAFGNYQGILEKERKQDPSDSGIKSFYISEASRPNVAIKRKWFTSVTENPDNLKISSLRGVMNHLFPTEQVNFEKPYQQKIEDHISKLNEGADLNMLSAYTRAMLSDDCTSSSSKRYDALLERFKNAKPQVVKALKAFQQRNQRCQKALKLI